MNEYVLGGDLWREPLRKIKVGKNVGEKKWGKILSWGKNVSND